MIATNMSWLITCPSSDGNFRYRLKNSTMYEIQSVLDILASHKNGGGVVKRNMLNAQLRKLKRIEGGK